VEEYQWREIERDPERSSKRDRDRVRRRVAKERRVGGRLSTRKGKSVRERTTVSESVRESESQS